MELNNKIDELFSLMDNWRMLPAYQLERRADIFFALYMNTIIKAKYGDEIDILIPEFPVRVGDIIDTAKNPNLSFKIDYVAVSESSKRVYFIELKTDNSSRRDKQDDYLEKARGINIIKLIDGVLAINKATKQKRKYKNLLSILNMAGWVNIENDICSNSSCDYEIVVTYIQPTTINNDDNVISFLEVASYISQYSDHLTQRFSESLLKWVNNPNDVL